MWENLLRKRWQSYSVACVHPIADHEHMTSLQQLFVCQNLSPANLNDRPLKKNWIYQKVIWMKIML